MVKRVADVLIETLQSAGVKRCYGSFAAGLRSVAG